MTGMSLNSRKKFETRGAHQHSSLCGHEALFLLSTEHALGTPEPVRSHFNMSKSSARSIRSYNRLPPHRLSACRLDASATVSSKLRVQENTECPGAQRRVVQNGSELWSDSIQT